MKRIAKQSVKSIQPLSGNTDNLVKLTFKDLLPGFLGIFLPSVLIISLITYGLLHQYQVHQQQLRIVSTLNSVENLVADVELTFRNITSDLHYLAKSNVVRSFADGDENAAATMAYELLHFALQKGLYEQLRFIDTSGMERVRINYYAGQAAIVSEDALQNKKGRYYFKDSLSLSRDKIFVSPLDLNIEHGQIERPFKPMIRFGIPVFDSDGHKKGIILLNFLAEKLLARFRNRVVDAKGGLSVLNRNGYWLFSSDPHDEWGFMFPDRQELTFGKRFPEAWHEIRENRSGQVSVGKTQFIYDTVYPITSELHSSTGSGTAYESSRGMLGAQDYFWKVVRHHPVVTLFDVIRTSGFWILYCLTILGIGMGTWFRSRSLLHSRLMLKQLKLSRSELKKQVDERTSELLESHQQLELLLASTGEGLYGINAQGRCTFANRACLKLLGYHDEGQLLEKNMHKLIHHSHADGSPYDEALCPIVKAYREGEGIYLDDEVFWRADGSAFASEIRSYPVRRDGILTGAVVTFNDISERKRIEAALQKNDEILNATQHLTKVGGWEWDVENKLMYWTDEVYRLHELDPNEFLPGSEDHIARSLECYELEDRQTIYDAFQRCAKEGVAYDMEFQFTTVKGRRIWIRTTAKPVMDQGRVSRVVGNIMDITENKHAEMELQHLATHDPLTGLYNRKVLEQRISDETLRATRYEHSLSVFMLDIDYFKQVNDTYGHKVGDTVLCNIAKILEDSIRKTDYAARYGGEEFIIILPETALFKAEELAERLCKIIAGHTVAIVDDEDLRITASIGIATFPEHAQTWEDLLEAADSAMYAAKKAGRNQVKTSSLKLH